ncbi:MAG: hypothetical protein IPG84_03515 [Betaproteobacteria bacterium]|nr:hypothetical protein [Betaproteobacteria bacterium]
MRNAEGVWRGRLIDPVDRISEILFGLIMAVTIVGSLSIATPGDGEVRTVLAAALGCNVAWGLVDAVMYLVRTMTERVRVRSLSERVIAADAATGRRMIAEDLPPHVARVMGSEEIESMRQRALAMEPVEVPVLRRDDWLAALGIFLLVVAATFPVVVPFMITDDLPTAMRGARLVTLAMLFLAGHALGRHAGHRHPLRVGIAMMLFGAVLIVAVMALGG